MLSIKFIFCGFAVATVLRVLSQSFCLKDLRVVVSTDAPILFKASIRWFMLYYL